MKTLRISIGRWILTCLAALGLALAAVLPARAEGAVVTAGEFVTYADGLARGYAITGRAHMTRTASGETIVSTHVSGLAPNTTYGVHVHNRACSDANGGGHYQNVPGGAVDAANEIWPAFTTNPAGIGNGFAVHAFTARPEARAVVVHDTDGKRIACADLN